MKTMTAKLILPYLLLCCIGLSSFTQTESSPEIYTIVEKKAEFVGGEEAMFKYIGENLSYPESADSIRSTNACAKPLFYMTWG
ncbi:MAG: hypothetical protein CL842_11770 [Crocinitomicaceae bacterium]|nr:hypothetical protein [Crocinitomicaceae bacterium]|tara:strand:- start:6607 stop:6855 length:249 start_codon:yes stop_codon:yes gene_type:complete